jgi:hypothetical protein
LWRLTAMLEYKSVDGNNESIWDDHHLPLDNMDLLQKVRWELSDDGNILLSFDESLAKMVKSKICRTDLPKLSWHR